MIEALATTPTSDLQPQAQSAKLPALLPNWFTRLRDDERRLVTARQRAMQIIKAAPSVKRGAEEAAALYGGMSGFAAKRLSSLFTQWRDHSEDNRILVNAARYPWIMAEIDGRSAGGVPSLAPAFIDFVGGLYLENKRSMGDAWRALVRRWMASWINDEKLPGIMPDGTAGSARDYWRVKDVSTLRREACPETLPAGWSKSNLRGIVVNWCAITPAEIALARRGTAAMRELLPTLHNSRVGCEFGQHLFADDLHHDFEILVPDVNPPHQRPLEIGIIDYASAVYGPFVCQPTLPMDDGTKRMLGWNCVKYAFGSWLELNGVPLDWPIYLHVENGTATVNPDEARIWHAMSGGIINICYTEMQGKYCLAWDEKRVGNYRGKAPLEGVWPLHHNYEAALPGYVGRNRDNCPAVLQGQRREALALLKWAATQPPDVVAKLKLPLLTYDEFVPLRMDIVAEINARNDHNLEGFERVPKWRPQGVESPWQPLSEFEKLPMHARQFVDQKSFIESPAERRTRLRARGRWAACPPAWLAMIYAYRATPLTVAKGTIVIKRGSSRWWYMADTHTAMTAAKIENGREYLVAYNPFNMQCIHLLTDKGQYLATWQQRGQRLGDKDATARSIAHRLGLQREVQDKVERLLISSGSTLDVEFRRDQNVVLGAPAARRNLINPASADSSAPAPVAIDDAANGAPATPVDPARRNFQKYETPADESTAEQRPLDSRDRGTLTGPGALSQRSGNRPPCGPEQPFNRGDVAVTITSAERKMGRRLTEEQQADAARIGRERQRAARAAERLAALYD